MRRWSGYPGRPEEMLLYERLAAGALAPTGLQAFAAEAQSARAAQVGFSSGCGLTFIALKINLHRSKEAKYHGVGKLGFSREPVIVGGEAVTICADQTGTEIRKTT